MSYAKLTIKQVNEIIRRHEDGEIYKDLANEFGVSVSLVQRYCAKNNPYVRRPHENNKIVYNGFRHWLVDNNMSIRRMAKEIQTNYHTLYYALIGKRTISKAMIDRMLEYTGMPYEVAFSKNDG